MTKKIDIVPTRVIPPDPVLGFFCHFYVKVLFSLEGLVKVEHLVLARIRSDFGATVPARRINLVKRIMLVLLWWYIDPAAVGQRSRNRKISKSR